MKHYFNVHRVEHRVIWGHLISRYAFSIMLSTKYYLEKNCLPFVFVAYEPINQPQSSFHITGHGDGIF